MQGNRISFSNSFSREMQRVGLETRLLFSFFRLDYLQELLIDHVLGYCSLIVKWYVSSDIKTSTLTSEW